MSQIVMLDNEPARIGPWLQALQKVHGPDRVELITTVAAALDRFEGAPIDVLVWDLMMPRGPLDEGATEYSTRTGEVLYRRFRERWPGAPAILLTNVLDQSRLRALFEATPESGSQET
jgi:CheY-like chemotaxis protein